MYNRSEHTIVFLVCMQLAGGGLVAALTLHTSTILRPAIHRRAMLVGLQGPPKAVAFALQETPECIMNAMVGLQGGAGRNRIDDDRDVLVKFHLGVRNGLFEHLVTTDNVRIATWQQECSNIVSQSSFVQPRNWARFTCEAARRARRRTRTCALSLAV